MARKRRGFDEDFFGFDREFERMREEMEELMEQMMGRIPGEDLEREVKRLQKGGGGVYGFSINIGPGGKPVIREFGNVRPEAAGDEKMPISEEREPLVDVIDGKADMTVMAEVPGVDRKDIRIGGEGKSLDIRVGGKDRKYHKELDLPSAGDFANARAKYNNGVLEIVVPKSAKGSAGASIRVD